MKRVLLLLPLILAALACQTLSGGDTKQNANDFEGFFTSGFEVSSFVPCGMSGDAGYGEGYWLTGIPEVYQQYQALAAESGHNPGTGYLTVYIRFEGERSPEGYYGHLGAYSHEVQATKLLEMSLDGQCK